MEKRKTAENLNFRKLALDHGAGGPATLDEKTRSVMVTAATENPVQVFDWSRGEVVDEILLMAGAEIPASRQCVLLDGHERGASASVIGSLREIKISGAEMVGRVFFAADADAIFRKVAEGHLTDFSIGYRVIKSEYVPANETAVINGRTINGGPNGVKVAVRWRIKELSAVPIGADEQAKTRGAIESDPQTQTPDPAKRSENNEREFSKMEIDEIRKQERERIAELTGLCHTFRCDDLLQKYIEDGTTVDAARAVILERAKAQMQQPIGGPSMNAWGEPHYAPATVTADATDKRVDAQVDGLLLRAGIIANDEKIAGGATEYAHFSFIDHARECLRAQGKRVNGGPDQIFREALHTRALVTGDLPTILGNMANKSALIGFTEATAQITQICKVISANDFKNQTLTKLSEASDLEEVPEHGDYQYGEKSEFAETYQLATYGKIFAISRQALINDDLGLLASIPRGHGAAAARKVRDVVIAVLTANANMSDGNALFSATHSNFVGSGSGAAPSDVTLKAVFLAMTKQTGPAGSVLGIRPRYLVVPSDLEIDTWQLLESTGDLTSEKNAGVKNPWYKRLVLVPEPALSSSTGWYVSADPNAADALVISYLNGNPAPYLEQKDGWTTDGTEYKVRIDVAAKAADWRGLYFNYGS